VSPDLSPGAIEGADMSGDFRDAHNGNASIIDDGPNAFGL
jgi:hypothetical protein